MNLSIVKTTASNVGKVFVKHAPQIWTGVGIAGVLGGVVFAVKAGMKTPDILHEHHLAMEDLQAEHKALIDSGKLNESEEIQRAKEYRHDAFTIYRDTACMFAREYWPAVVAVGGGLACIIWGHRVLTNRNRVLAAALTTTTDAYNRYRQTVREKYGEEVDTAIANGLKEETRTIETVDEDGKKRKEKVKELVTEDGKVLSPYARFFDETSREWVKTPGYNHTFLKCQQEAANKLLYSRFVCSGKKHLGWVFLNEVYEMLGLDPSPEGQLVGWVYTGKEEDKSDGYISFGMHDVRNPQKMAFEAGFERSILLDFNVDGTIYDKL